MAKSKTKTIYICQSCGSQKPRWEGRCTECGEWNSLVEETQFSEPKTRGWPLGVNTASESLVLSLDQSVEQVEFQRHSTQIHELDRVFGGGLVQGSFVLLGGAPGIGKSTLLMQMAGGLAKNKLKVLYISGEESVAQTASRAQRLGIRSPSVQVGSESNLLKILDLTHKHKPQILIVDSIQTVFHPDLEAAPGTVSQVRDCAGYLMNLAKKEAITVILIGHITKDGSLAGPKVLEHMVDCVLSFDGDMHQNFRLLRSLKNRFGPTHELGVFQMSQAGLKEVENPSELFLEERGENLMGSVVFSSMEGTRPLLCEVQALSIETPMAMPRRTSLGIDPQRLQMVASVLDRHINLNLSHRDVFINVVGGLKLVEPSSDLAVAAALLSSEYNLEIHPKTVFFGELGLTGEIRAVSYPDLRIKEADKLGFEYFVIPYSNLKNITELQLNKNKKILTLKRINQLYPLLKKGLSQNKHEKILDRPLPHTSL